MALCVSVFSRKTSTDYPDSKETKDQAERLPFVRLVYADAGFFLFNLVPVRIIDSLGLTEALKRFSQRMFSKAVLLLKHFTKGLRGTGALNLRVYADEGSTGGMKDPFSLGSIAGYKLSLEVEKEAEKKHPEVAAASIIAKYFRDIYMSEVPKVGYLNNHDERKQITLYRKQARLNFENVRKELKKHYYEKWINLLSDTSRQEL